MSRILQTYKEINQNTEEVTALGLPPAFVLTQVFHEAVRLLRETPQNR